MHETCWHSTSDSQAFSIVPLFPNLKGKVLGMRLTGVNLSLFKSYVQWDGGYPKNAQVQPKFNGGCPHAPEEEGKGILALGLPQFCSLCNVLTSPGIHDILMQLHLAIFCLWEPQCPNCDSLYGTSQLVYMCICTCTFPQGHQISHRHKINCVQILECVWPISGIQFTVYWVHAGM